MALNKEEIASLKSSLKLVKGKKSGFFLYCAGGADGDPVLKISKKRIPRQELTELKKTARKKKFVQGDVLFEAPEDGEAETFIFVGSEGTPGGFKKHIHAFFGRALPPLKKARFSRKGEAEVVVDDSADAVSADDTNRSGIQQSGLDRVTASGMSQLDGQTLNSALSDLDLNDINFDRVDISDKPLAEQKEQFGQQIQDMTLHIKKLEDLLQIVYNQRLKAEQDTLRMKAEYGELRRAGADKTTLGNKKKDGVEARILATNLLDRENELRKLLEVAHAQMQNCILDREEAANGMTEEAALSNLSAEERETVQQAALAQEMICNQHSAQIDQLSLQIDALDKERRAAEATLANKETVALKKMNDPKFEDKARRRLAEIASRKDALFSDLSQYRLELDREQVKLQLKQAQADDVMAQWSDKIKGHWDARQNVEDEAFYNESLRELTGKDLALKNSLKTVRELEQRETGLQNQKEATERELEELRNESTKLNAKMLSDQRLLQNITDRIKKAGWLTNTSALQAEQKRLQDSIASYREQIQNADGDARQARIQELEGRLQTASDELSTCQTERQAEQQKADALEKERNNLLLSPEETQQLEALGLKQKAADAEVIKKQGELDQLKADEEAIGQKLSDFKAAESEQQQAQAALLQIQAHYRAVKKDADKWRIGGKGRRDKIDAARTQLPQLELQLRAAEAALAQANEKLREKRADIGTDANQEALYEDLERIRTERLSKEGELADANAFKAEVEKQRKEQEASVTTLVEDVMRERRNKHHDLLVQSLAGTDGAPIQQKLIDAKAAKKAANDELQSETDKLVSHKVDLTKLRLQIAATNNPKALLTLSTQQRELLANIQTQTTIVQEKEAALETAKAANRAAKQELMDYAESVKGNTDLQADYARDFLSAEESFLHAKEQQIVLAEEAVQAQEDAEKAAQDKVEAGRKAEVLHAELEIQQLLSSEKARDIMKNFHYVSEDLQTMECLDLLSEEDQKKIKKDKDKAKAYKDLLRLQAKLDKQAIEMISKGATKSELEQAFASIPNTLRPAAYRAEISRFEDIQQALEETRLEDQLMSESAKLAAKESPQSAVAKMKALVAEAGGTFNDKALEPLNNAVGEFDTLLQNGLLMDADGNLCLSAEQFGNFDSADVTGIKTFMNSDHEVSGPTAGDAGTVHGINGRITAAYGAMMACKSVLEYATTDTDVMDPVEKQAHEDKLFSVISESTSAFLQVGANFGGDMGDLVSKVPVLNLLGMADKSKQMVESLVEAGARQLNKNYDQYLQLAARAAGSALANAFAESKVHEGHLRTKYGIKTLTSVAGITADVLCASPLAPVGAIVGAVTYMADKFANASLHEVERKRIIEAKRMLDRANQGDEVAKVKLTEKHALYAKGLIAYMAEQKDGFALAYVRKRGLSDEAVAGSSQAIVMRYLLDKAEQSEDQYDDENLIRFKTAKNIMNGCKRIIGNIAGFFGGSLWELESDTFLAEVAEFENTVQDLGPMNKQATKLTARLQKAQKEKGIKKARVRHLQKQIDQVKAYQDSFTALQQEQSTILTELLTKVSEAQARLVTLRGMDDDELGRGELREKNGLEIIVPVASSGLKNCFITLNSLS